MTDNDCDGDDLGRFLDAARAQAPVPSEELLRRVAADAVRLRPRVARRRVRARGRQLAAPPGGWVGLSGLAAATAIGMWLGYAPPTGWPDPMKMLMRTDADLALIESDELAFVLSVEER